MSKTFFEKKIISYFKNVFDTNSDNFITFEDFEISVERYRVGNNLKHDDPKVIGQLAGLKMLFDQLLRMADTNKDGKVSLEEFVIYWKGVQNKIKNGASLQDLDLEEWAGACFKNSDADGDGIFSKTDYKMLCQSINQVHDEKEIEKSWQKLEKLGTLDKKRYKEVFSVYFSSENEEDPENYIIGPIIEF